MLTAVAVCPHPPLLVPQVAAGAAGELDELRSACLAATSAVTAGGADVVVLGVGMQTMTYDAEPAGSFAGYGVDVRVGTGPAVLPLSLTVGRWLLDAAGWSGSATCQTVAATADAAECDALGAALAADPTPTTLLVLADGSARRSVQAPGYLDERAEPFDAAVAAALAAGDPDALRALDRDLALALLAGGWPCWRVLGVAGAGVPWQSTLHWSGAPYGVGYHVATWRR